MERWRIQAARGLAIAADVVQLGLMPLFGEGALSPLDDALDLVVGGAMIWLVGWHWAFAPAFVAELVPGVDLVPTWTAAAFMATWGKLPARPERTVEALPPETGRKG